MDMLRILWGHFYFWRLPISPAVRQFRQRCQVARDRFSFGARYSATRACPIMISDGLIVLSDVDVIRLAHAVSLEQPVAN